MSLPGKNYEMIVASICRSFAGAAEVTTDDRIVGRSGRARQIDIAIRERVIGYPLLVIVECKDYTRSVDIGKVDELIGKLDDVSANKGILVSDSKFTRGAIDRANQDPRIHLASVVDTLNGNLRNSLKMEVHVTFVDISTPCTYIFEAVHLLGDEKIQVPFDLRVRSDRDELREYLKSHGPRLAHDLSEWSKNDLPNLVSGPKKYHKVVHESSERRISMTCKFSTTVRSFINQNIFVDGFGIYDEQKSKWVKCSIQNSTFEQERIVHTWTEVFQQHRFESGAPHYRRINYISIENALQVLNEVAASWNR